MFRRIGGQEVDSGSPLGQIQMISYQSGEEFSEKSDVKVKMVRIF
jgi:hypothetical protein